MLEVLRPVTYADDEDANRVAGINDDEPSLPQTKTAVKAGDDEMVEIQTQQVSAVPIPSKEP